MSRTCACGCGEEVNVYQGRPRRFVHGHNSRSDHPTWKGGRDTSGNNGYALLTQWSREPGRSPRKYEHVLIAERALGKPLPAGAEVHHVNGNRQDNRPRNLVVCQDRAYHHLLHRRQRALDASGHPDWLKCSVCHHWDAPENLSQSSRNAYHKGCAASYVRARRDGITAEEWRQREWKARNG